MFSFRTTPLIDQLDKALKEGDVACFCTQNCWDASTGNYMYEIFRQRGNLKALFLPRDTELTPGTNHIQYSPEELENLAAIVVEIQDVGTRYFNYTKDVMGLMNVLKEMKDDAPSLYIVDHINPAGRVVEGSMISSPAELNVPKVPHRHGLTLGELANLYYTEINAKFPLHIISALASENKQFMPWTIAPASDIPGLFTCEMYSGGGLWNNTNVTPGIGTTRPYEYIGSPFIVAKLNDPYLPKPNGVLMRPCSFMPSVGRYEGERCYGYQIILQPGFEYHSLLHTLQLIRYFKEKFHKFRFETGFKAKLSDSNLMDYLEGKITLDEMKEYVKVEEQKWIRKAKRFILYDNPPVRMK